MHARDLARHLGCTWYPIDVNSPASLDQMHSLIWAPQVSRWTVRGGLCPLGVEPQSWVNSLFQHHLYLRHLSWNTALSFLAGTQKHRMPTLQCKSIISNWHPMNSLTNGGNPILATWKDQKSAMPVPWGKGGFGCFVVVHKALVLFTFAPVQMQIFGFGD